MSRGPDFLVIGAMKCATSMLHDQLAAQTGFFMSELKEPNFFSDDDQWQRGWDWYLSLFADGQDARIRGESSTHYTKLPTHPETVERIREHLPSARFVYVMRDPVDRLVSQYIHEWTERTIRGPIGAATDRYPRLVSYSRYAMQLRPYLESFGADRVLPVFFEALRDRPQLELERVARFLEFEDEVQWRDGLRVRNVSRDRLRRNPVRDFLIHQRLLARLRRALVSEETRERVKNLWRMRERPVLPEIVRERVVAELDDDLAELSKWLGIELNCGNFSQKAMSSVPEWTSAVPGAASA